MICAKFFQSCLRIFQLENWTPWKRTLFNTDIDIEEPTSELEITLLKDMCVHASKTIKLQCGREYGFGQYNDIRATQIHKLTVEERKDLESNNVMCERELGVFDHRAIVSKCRNNKFKAKSLRNDMVLHSVSLDGASKISR